MDHHLLLRPPLFRDDVPEVRTLHYAERGEMVEPPKSMYWPVLVGGPFDRETRIVPDAPSFDTFGTDGKTVCYVRHYMSVGSSPVVRFYAHWTLSGRGAISQAWGMWTVGMNVI